MSLAWLLLGPGRLKVYLGYAVGVGKTHRALMEAQELKRRGVDVAVGWLEPKDRPLLGALAQGLEVIPPKRVGAYEVLDLEAILKRRPATLLVDELARRNPPGQRRRWEEVEALLEAGISVITTLNAYHLESLAEAAGRLLPAPPEERVPDRLLAQADEVVAVDLPPEELLRRLRRLPAYREAGGLFLSLPTLRALRELTLRHLAELLEPGFEFERLLVLVPEDWYWFRRLVDYAALRARRLGGEFLVLHPRPRGWLGLGPAPPLAPERRRRMEAYVAERGGSLLVREGGFLPLVLEALRELKAQALVLGHGGRRPWPPPGLLRALLRRLRGVEVHLIPEAYPQPRRPPSRREPKGSGRLKVFLGMAPGVGKTYAMLQEAHALKAEGVDVVVGLVETHGRPETAALLQGLEVLPRRPVLHQGVTLMELDLEGLLKRRPQVALVDELPHTNPPGLPHAKRYQDVLALTRAGIQVHTALNVQHLESVAGLVERLTGIRVRERVPDWVLAEADEVVLVDLTPEALQARIAEGKVYPGVRGEEALGRFFTLENLKALRELALAETRALAAPPPEPSGPVLAYGGGRVLERAARIAEHLEASLVVLLEEATPETLALAEAHRARLTLLGPLGREEGLFALETYARRLTPSLIVLPLAPLGLGAVGRLPYTLLLVDPGPPGSPGAQRRPGRSALGGAGPPRRG